MFLHRIHIDPRCRKLAAIFPIPTSFIPHCVGHSARRTRNALNLNSCGGLRLRRIQPVTRAFLFKAEQCRTGQALA